MNIRKAAERAAINAPMQGTNADIIKLAMIQIDHVIQSEKWDMHMIMQVHDELVFEISEAILPIALAKIKEIMENVIKLSVRLHVNIGVADNWEAAH
jgi:DNA polymerase-1